MYFSDYGNYRIRKVTPGGTISTVVGNGSFGSGGDGGPATSATIDLVTYVAFDSSGNLFFGNLHNVRKVTPGGTISTVVGNGTLGNNGDGGPATSAELWSPCGLTFDSIGNLYITDFNNETIRKVTPAGIITTVAGNGTKGNIGDGGAATSAEFNVLYGATIDSKGNLYIADTRNNRIRRITGYGGGIGP